MTTTDERLANHLGGVHAIAELAPVELAGALAPADAGERPRFDVEVQVADAGRVQEAPS